MLRSWTRLASRRYRNEMVDGGDLGGAAPAPEATPLDPESAFLNLLDDEGGIKADPALEPTDATPEPKPAPEVKPEAKTPDTDTPPADEPRFKVKINGEEVEVTQSELINGYQRQSDYTKKTQEVAEQRKAAEAEASKAQTERAQYAQNLAALTWQLNAAVMQDMQTDWTALAESDPAEYVKQKAAADQRMLALQQAHGEQQKILAQQQAEQQQHLQTHLTQQQEALLAKLPEWRDADKAKAEKAALRDFLKEAGFNDNELGQLTDHRTVLVARDAMLYRQMMAQADVAKQKVEKLPPKVERPGVSDDGQRQVNRENLRLLRKTGKDQYAIKAIEDLL